MNVSLSSCVSHIVNMKSLLVKSGLCSSKSEAQRMIKAGAVSVNVCPEEIKLGYPWEKVKRDTWIICPETMVRVGRKMKLVSLT